MSDPETLRVYDAKAADYAARFGKDVSRDASLVAFLSALPEAAKVLDLGCGPGTWAAQMARAGLHVEAWDASQSMVDLASGHAGVTARLARFDDLTAEAAYDGIWANFSLLHAPHAEIPAHLSRISRALRPGGTAHFGLKEGDGEARDGLGRFYSYHRVAPFCAMLRQAGLEPGTALTGRDKGLDGTYAAWFTLLARKP